MCNIIIKLYNIKLGKRQMDIVDGKIFHKELPELLLQKLKKMSFIERKRLLSNLEDPKKKLVY